MDDQTRRRLAELLGSPVASLTPLSGGCVAEVRRADLQDGRRVVVKLDASPDAKLDVEGMMLRRLRRAGAVRVPDVLHAEPRMLVIEYVEHDGRRSAEGEARLAERLAALHATEGPHYGYDADTLIGSLHQPNPPEASWPAFFGRHRLLHMGRRADAAGSLAPGVLGRLERLAADIERMIDPPPDRPSLIHGDIWSGNVLWDRGEPAALIDPAIYWADPEIELAFIDLMGGMGPTFWERYRAVGTIRPGFFEVRKDLYNLYPLLVHATLFGGGYGASVAGTLASLGY